MLELLKNARANSPPALFALAGSYFSRERLAEAENRLIQDGRNGQALKAYRLPRTGVHARCVDWLEGPDSAEREAKREVRELMLLKGLDARLHKERSSLLRGPHLGADGQLYWICKRNAFLADHLSPQPSWAGDQSPSIATYCRHHMLVPAAPVDGVKISPIGRTEWGTSRLHVLLRSTCRQLTLMVHPFSRIRYPSLAESGSSETVLLDEIENERALIEEISQVVAEAAQERATILIFPELTFTERMLGHLASSLAKKPYEDGPLLTVAGCCHRKRQGGRSAHNEALLLGPDGRTLHRHAKLTRYTWQEEGKPRAEATVTGTELGVLECALGNLAIAICLDVFGSQLQAVINASHANFFLVPSLSKKTGDHRRAARGLVRSHRAATVVSNQHLEDRATIEGTSFVLLPGGAPYEWPQEGQASPPSLIVRPRLDSSVGQE
jgi:predicted amidohydrolase